MSVDLGRFDVCIVGLGVAGSNLASLLSPHLKVIAIDKKRKSGDCFDSGFHKPCGGLLSEGGQRAIAKQGLTLPESVMTHPQIFAINTIDYGFSHASYIQKSYINMERHRFDLWLKSRIPAHIEVWHTAWFKSIERVDSLSESAEVRDASGNVQYLVRFKHNDGAGWRDYHCVCKYVVGADGAKSHIRRWLYPKLKTPTLVCVQEWYEERNHPMLSCIFDSQLTTSYSWSMSKEGYFIFGGAYPHNGCQSAFATQLTRLKELGFVFGEPIKREACLVLQPTRWRDFVSGRDGVFLIGEAGGFINASTLEGISGAMHSSRILARVFNSADFDSNLNSAYHRLTRPLALKTLIRHYLRYPFMFMPFLRRLILRLGILRVRPGLEDGRIV